MKDVEQEIDCLKLREEGIRLEFEYVNNLKDNRIQLLKEELKKIRDENIKLKEQITIIEEKLSIKSYSLEKIQNSRWWKIRKIFKRRKKNG